MPKRTELREKTHKVPKQMTQMNRVWKHHKTLYFYRGLESLNERQKKKENDKLNKVNIYI